MNQTKEEYLAGKPEPTYLIKQPREAGLVTQIAAMLRAEEPDKTWNRAERRRAAKSYIHDPIQYENARREAKLEAQEKQKNRGFVMSLIQNLFKSDVARKVKGLQK